MSFKIIFSTFSFSILFSITTFSQYWRHVGDVGISDSTANNIAFALSDQNVPFVAYNDIKFQNKLCVKSYQNGNWNYVGSPGISLGSVGQIKMFIDAAGNPYVAYKDDFMGGKITVLKYDAGWDTVGVSGFTPAPVSSFESFDFGHDLGGEIYIAFQDQATANWQASVMRWDGANWNFVGNQGFTPDYCEFVNLSFSSSNFPVVAFQDGSLSNSNCSVMEYNGVSWNYVPGGASISPSTAWSTDIAHSLGGDILVVYEDDDVFSEASVMKFDGTNWTQLGAQGFSNVNSVDTRIDVSGSDIPYVAFKKNTQQGLGVMYYDGGTWVQAGVNGFPDIPASRPEIKINNSNTPFVGYIGELGKVGVQKMCFNSTFSTINPILCSGQVYTSPSGKYSWTVDGTYIDTLYGGNIAGCDSIITINLDIQSSFSFVNETYCVDTVISSPSGNYNYSTTGLYSDTIPNHLGCDSIITLDLSFTLIDDSIYALGGDFYAYHTGGSYQWLDCSSNFGPINGAIQQNFTPTSNGAYSVQITLNGCTDTSECLLINNVGINENSSASQNFSIYPNPTRDQVNIKTYSPKTHVELYDMTGKLIAAFDSSESSIDLSGLENGIYNLLIATEDGIMFTTVIKE